MSINTFFPTQLMEKNRLHVILLIMAGIAALGFLLPLIIGFNS